MLPFSSWLAKATPASHIRRADIEPRSRRTGSVTLVAGSGTAQPLSNLAQPVLASLRQLVETLYLLTVLLVFGPLSNYNRQATTTPISAFKAAPASAPAKEVEDEVVEAEEEEEGASLATPETAGALVEVAISAKTEGGKKFAYVTLLTKDNYLPGVQALLRSVRLVGGSYPFIVLYTKGVSQSAVDALRQEGCVMQFAEQFQPKGIDHSEYKRSLYLECWNKLRMWEMTQFDRLVYLDADMIVCRNIDHLFDLPTGGFYAVGDCYGGREFAEERDNCCHFTPEKVPEYFNAGFYVMTPSLEELRGMEEALAEGRVTVRFFAEQDFLNGYFKGKWKHLPYTYNAQKRIKYHHPTLWRMEDIHIVHIVDEKPWDHRYSEENMAYQEIMDYWWDVYTGKLGGKQVPAVMKAGHAPAEAGEEESDEDMFAPPTPGAPADRAMSGALPAALAVTAA
ncbi:hypothetical protein N2152v2_007753 [Parachlorella kessleri]